MTRSEGGVGSKIEALVDMKLVQFQFLAIFTGGGWGDEEKNQLAIIVPSRFNFVSMSLLSLMSLLSSLLLKGFTIDSSHIEIPRPDHELSQKLCKHFGIVFLDRLFFHYFRLSSFIPTLL